MSQESRAADEAKETGRLEAFSDGVFAVAITLLVLDLVKVPEVPADGPDAVQNLGGALISAWPSYLTFVISFVTILIMWMNHHSIFREIQRSDAPLMLANGFLLLLVTLVPFPTALLGEYLLTAAAPAAAAAYAGLFVFISVAYPLLWLTAVRRGLLVPTADPRRVAQRTRANLLGIPAYLLMLICAFWVPLLSVAIGAVLWIFWIITSHRLG